MSRESTDRPSSRSSHTRGLLEHDAPPQPDFPALQAAWRKRPARKQAQDTGPKGPVTMSGEHPSTEYNIWYHRRADKKRQHWSDARSKSKTRCCVVEDAGRTQGNLEPRAFICFNFAKGRCTKGERCKLLHDIPDEEFEKGLGMVKDCFGRDRHATNRDDRGGVGSFNADDETQRTLFVAGIRRAKDIEEVVFRQFGEFGPVEYVKCFCDRAFAFVRFKRRCSAEFAKVAMAEQSLFGHDVLNIRWANDDISTTSRNRRYDAAKKQAHAAVDARVAQIATEHGLGPMQPETESITSITLADGSTVNVAQMTTFAGSDGQTYWFDGTYCYTKDGQVFDPKASSTNDAQAATGTHAVANDDSTTQLIGPTAPTEAQSGQGSQSVSEEERQAAWQEYYAQMGYTMDPTTGEYTLKFAAGTNVSQSGTSVEAAAVDPSFNPYSNAWEKYYEEQAIAATALALEAAREPKQKKEKLSSLVDYSDESD
eukprot:m.255772 g.255772  ORF g.255772 m.255772 type:complete len:482 (+) comp15507_c0_seq2:161-1606(+)